MLKSLFINNPAKEITIWLLHRNIPAEKLTALSAFCIAHHSDLQPVCVDETLFAAAPVSDRYPQEMYYRLLAPHLLPPAIDRVLYLDPDTLIINPLQELYELDLEGQLFAAAAHTGKTEFANEINKVRLGTDHSYYNSGVLLIDCARGREAINAGEIYTYVEANKPALLLPDQDVLNGLYGKRILALDDDLWNYDARNYMSYLLRSGGKTDVDWVMANTAILHFCGSAKPWKPNYIYRFGVLYKHYAQLTTRSLSNALTLA